eukprot:COSAG05_NODE_20133_length_282_cov_1.688525_1_plen_80_part_01
MTRVKIYIYTRIYDELTKCQVVRCRKTRSLGVQLKSIHGYLEAHGGGSDAEIKGCRNAAQWYVVSLSRGARMHESLIPPY